MPTLRGEADTLYALQGDLKGFESGDAMCVRATLDYISFYM